VVCRAAGVALHRGETSELPGLYRQGQLDLAGTGRAVVGDEQYEIGPGCVVYTPAGTYHQFFNTGTEPVKLYWYYTPSGAERAVLEGAFR